MGAEREWGPTDTQPQDWVEGVQESGWVSWCSEVALPLLTATSLEMGVGQGRQRGSLSSWHQVCRVVAPLPLPEAAALATRSSNSVLAKTTLLGLDAIPTYLLSQ